jgi:NADH-quinone oxidoreductase subunit E
MICKKLISKNAPFVFSDENKNKLDSLKTRYPTLQALLLPTLWLVQNQDGYISKESIEVIAKELKLDEVYIYSVASFYAMYNFAPRGKYHIKVCKTLSCNLRGAEDLIEFIEQYTNIECGDDSSMYSLSEVECLGHCEVAPVVEINGEFFKSLDTNELKNIMDSLCK